MYISKYIVRLQSDYSHHRYGVARHVMNGVLFDLPGCALTERARKTALPPPSPHPLKRPRNGSFSSSA